MNFVIYYVWAFTIFKYEVFAKNMKTKMAMKSHYDCVLAVCYSQHVVDVKNGLLVALGSTIYQKGGRLLQAHIFKNPLI